MPKPAMKHVNEKGQLTLLCPKCGGFYIKCLIWGHIKGVK